MSLRRPAIAIACGLLLPVSVAAQADSSARGRIGGTVYDSLARKPISGAVVELVPADQPSGPLRRGTTDSRGRYVISDVPPGRYLAAFQHVAMDSIGLESPVRLVDVRAAELSRLNFAVPSPATIVHAVCGRTGLADSTGLLMGVMRNARTRAPIDSGRVRAFWQEFIVDANGLRMSERDTSAAVGAEGWFRLCGVPGGVEVAVVSWSGADTTGVISASAPVGGLARRDLFLGGTALVRGVVKSERNRPIPNARVEVIGRERTATTDSAGAFLLAGVPAGTQTLEVRALGYAREHAPLELTAGGDTAIAFSLTTLQRMLDTIRVVGRRIYSRDSEGFERRRRMGIGRFIDPEEIARRKPLDLIHLFQQVPGVRVAYQGLDRRVMVRSSMGGYCVPDLYLDGMRMPKEMLGEWDMLVNPREVAGIEIYRGVETPPQFGNFSGCGSVVIWTRSPPPRPRR